MTFTKWILLGTLLFGIIARPGHAEADADPVPALNSLTTPPSPAFTLLGVSPASIVKPSTPSDFALTLLSQSGNLTEIPSDFALETAPYWLTSHARLKWQDDKERSITESVLRTFSISMATAEVGDSLVSSTGASVGFKTSLLSGRMSDSSVQHMEALQSALTNVAAIAQKLQNAWIQDKWTAAEIPQAKVGAWLDELAPDSANPAFDSLKASMTQLFQNAGAVEATVIRNRVYSIIRGMSNTNAVAKFSTRLRDEVEQDGVPQDLKEHWDDSVRTAIVTSSLRDFEVKRTGIKWEVAGGLIWDFPNQVANNGKLRGGGVWTTLSAPNIPYEGAEALFTARYINNELLAVDENVFDFGVRILYEFDKYLVSYEYVRRIPDFDFERDDEQWRQALVLEIELAPGKRVSLTVGEDFDRETADSFLAQLGLNIGIRNLGLAN